LLHSSYANYASARKSFYQETLLPKWQSLESKLTGELAKEFGDYIELRYDLSDIDALQEERKYARDYAIAGWDSGLLTKNEARRIVEEAPVANGDSFKIKSTETTEPAVYGEETPSLPASPEIEMLTPDEALAGAITIDWRALHKIADSAAPELKKNCCGQSLIRQKVSINRRQSKHLN
jgi:hypothetical protein